MTSISNRSEGAEGLPDSGGVDLREALCNEGRVGLAGMIQLPTERITRLNGLMLDLDPKLLTPGNPLFPPADDPRAFLERIGPVLDRHPLLRHAEVRSSGVGLHAILRFDPPVELASAADQKRWTTLVRVVQCSLPADPNAPGITALTRPVGSINSKNAAIVVVLRRGELVAPGRVEAFVGDLAAAPFRIVATILLGSERVAPCPLCLKPGSSLGVLDRGGTCYGCGKVDLERLFDVVYRPPGQEASAPDEVGDTNPPGPPEAGRKPKIGAKDRKPGRKTTGASRPSATS